MADLKISQLTTATSPLTGAETIPLVQSGTTKKVTVSDLLQNQPNTIRLVKSVSLSDNVATTLFTVTTTDEAGTNDGGTYACRVFLLASFTGSGSGGAAVAIASKSQEVMFTVANSAAGTVARSAVVTMHTTARADPGGFTDLTDPVVTLNGVSNFVTQVQVTSDGSGVVSAGQMTAIIELVYTNYATAPVIS